MSYAQRKEMSSNRTVSIVIVALIHVLLGYFIVTGLAYNVVKKAAEDLKTFDVEEEPPPPPEEPPPPPPEDSLPPPPEISSPPPLNRIPQVSPMQVPQTPAIPQPPTPVYVPAPPAPPAPPPAPRVSQPKSAVGNLQGVFTPDDYPESARDSDQQGTTSVVLTIGPNGRVSNCSVANSSGSSSLDAATCRVLRSRARFTPAQDSSGNPTTGTVRQPIRWVLAG